MVSKGLLFVSMVLLITVQMSFAKPENQAKGIEEDNKEGTNIKAGYCYLPGRLLHGIIDCPIRGELMFCTARCLPGYNFEGKENKKFIGNILKCDGKRQPKNLFPACIRKNGMKVNNIKKMDDYYDY